MREGVFIISNTLGFHARAAARFVKVANAFECEVSVYRDGERANGKSILGLLTLAAAKGTALKVVADGKDEAAALSSLRQLIEGKFGDEQ